VRTGVNVFFLLVVLVLAPDSDFSSSLFIQSGSSWWSSYFLLASCSPLGVASLESLLGPVADPCSQLGLWRPDLRRSTPESDFASHESFARCCDFLSTCLSSSHRARAPASPLAVCVASSIM
jgi:hypothetical protein